MHCWKNKVLPLGAVLNRPLAGLALTLLIGGPGWAESPAGTLISKSPAAIWQKSAADRQITGKVTDGDSPDGLPGVNVVIKGTQTGTFTDANGNYTIDVPEGGAILVYSFVGYLSQETETGTRNAINISLKADTKSLNEVVVVGYGTQKKVNLTGAVDQVGQEVLQNRPIPNLAQ